MLRFEWNALRIGDRVLVHDRSAAQLDLVPGVVTMVDSARGSNDIGIRTEASVIRPNRLGVHADPRDERVPCWQCDAAPTPIAGRS